jgi:RNA-directed DNA polymerase
MKIEVNTRIERNIFDELCEIDNLAIAFKAVKKNRGAAGIDGVGVKDFAVNLQKELEQLSNELRNWQYSPQPVRTVAIPKPDGGERHLGIPNVRDRVVQTAIKQLIEPLFEPEFSESSYGFRPGRGQQQAVAAAQAAAKAGKDHVVDIDLEKFFDRIHHDRLISRLGLKIKDKRILRLIGEILRSGVMQHGLVSASEDGVPQGSPLSPLLSNIVLDELDKELDKRELTFARFADDCNIFVSSQKAAERVMANMTDFIENKLKLKINQSKSKVARSEFVKFLGMTIVDGALMISEKSYKRAFDKVKELVRTRRSHLDITTQIKKINQWYVGWSNYYRMTQYPAQLQAIEAHIRRRLRAQFVDHAKSRRGILYFKLKEMGVSPKLAWATVNSNKRRWALSHSKALEKAYPNGYFKYTLGFKTASDKNLPHWFKLETWRKFP